MSGWESRQFGEPQFPHTHSHLLIWLEMPHTWLVDVSHAFTIMRPHPSQNTCDCLVFLYINSCWLKTSYATHFSLKPILSPTKPNCHRWLKQTAGQNPCLGLIFCFTQEWNINMRLLVLKSTLDQYEAKLRPMHMFETYSCLFS